MVQRIFYIGDEWLYYKLYCGKRTADQLLIETLKPLTEDLITQQVIDQWFFLRYSDPDFHIRIRFHLTDVAAIGNVIIAVNQALKNYVKEDLLWKIQTDTYQRELERYGMITIGLSEKLFYEDSKSCLKVLELVEDDEILFLFVVKSIDQLLTLFDFSLQEKLCYVTENEFIFKKEFDPDKTMNQAIKEKYRIIQKPLELFLTIYLENEYQPLEDVLEEKKQALQPIIEMIKKYKIQQRLEVSEESLIASYIHMMVNRTFRDQQRKYEWLLYNFLMRMYRTILSKNKSK